MNPYIGHDSQLYGVEEHRLVGGKGDGMRLFEVCHSQVEGSVTTVYRKSSVNTDVYRLFGNMAGGGVHS